VGILLGVGFKDFVVKSLDGGLLLLDNAVFWHGNRVFLPLQREMDKPDGLSP
jgi:hypothetical protein